MKENSSGMKRRKYDASFKEEVLKMVYNGRPVSEVARSVGIGENIITVGRAAAVIPIINSQLQLIRRAARLFRQQTIRFCSNRSGSWSVTS